MSKIVLSRSGARELKVTLLHYQRINPGMFKSIENSIQDVHKELDKLAMMYKFVPASDKDINIELNEILSDTVFTVFQIITFGGINK